MKRVFTKDVGKMFKSGDIKDFPTATWREIAKSAGEALEEFSEELAEVAKSFVQTNAKQPVRSAVKRTTKV